VLKKSPHSGGEKKPGRLKGDYGCILSIRAGDTRKFRNVGFDCCTQLPPTSGDYEMTEKEKKFYEDVRQLVLRAFRAGATIGSVQMVLQEINKDVGQIEPYLKAVLERDLAP
jgi:hypothetical protein